MPFASADPEQFLKRAFVIVLIPLPLAISGVALLAERREADDGE
jgi:hypothetical protein